MEKCSKCGSEIEQPMKEWDMRGNPHGPALHVKQYVCPQCGNRFRKADKILPVAGGDLSHGKA